MSQWYIHVCLGNKKFPVITARYEQNIMIAKQKYLFFDKFKRDMIVDKNMIMRRKHPSMELGINPGIPIINLLTKLPLPMETNSVKQRHKLRVFGKAAPEREMK